MTKQFSGSRVKKFVVGFLALCICVLTAANSQAASYSWDPGTVLGGGTWIWDTTTYANWYDASALPLPADIVWNNLATSAAVFDAGNLNGPITGGTVTVASGGVTANAITFNLTGYLLSPADSTAVITLTGTTPAIKVTTAGNTATIDSNISVTSDFTVSGDGDLTLGGNVIPTSAKTLTKSGNGTLTIGDAASTADNSSLNLNVTGGTVILAKPSTSSIHAVSNVTGVSFGATLKLGNATGDQIYNSNNISGMEGTFDLNGMSETIGSLSSTTTSGVVTNNSASSTSTLTLSANTGNFAGNIQNGAGSTGIVVLKVSGGNQTLSGVNTYTGGTTLSGGTLNINSSSALGTGTFSFTGGTIDNTYGSLVTLSATPQTWSGANIYFAGTNNLSMGTSAIGITANINVNVSAGTLTIGGPITNTAGFVDQGHGILNITGDNSATITGGPTITVRGTLAAGNTNAFGTGIIKLNYGSLQASTPLTGASKLMNAVYMTGDTNTGNDLLSVSQMSVISGSNDIELGGVVSNNAGTAAGSRNLNIYNTGVTTLSGTVYIVESAGASARTLTINASGPTIISGIIANNPTNSAAGSLQVDGNNTLTLSGANTFTGNTTLSSGTTVLDFTTNVNNKLCSTQTLVVNGGATLRLTGGTWAQAVSATTLSSGGALNITRGTNSPSLTMGLITRSVGSALNVGDSDDDLTTTTLATTTYATSTNGIIGSSTAWGTANGADWAVLTGSTPFSITAYPSASYTPTSSEGSWAATNNAFVSGTFPLTASREIYTLKIASTSAGPPVQSLTIGTGQTLQLDGGGLLMTGAYDYNITGGTLKAGQASPSELIVHQYSTGTLTISSTIANGNGASTLTKAGPGTLILNAANTYTGTTYVDAGTLALGIDNAIYVSSTHDISISGGGTFDLAGHLQTLRNANTPITSSLIGAGGTITSSVAGGVLTLNTTNTSGAADMLYTGLLKLVIKNAGQTAAFQMTNPNSTFTGGLTIQGNGTPLTTSLLPNTGGVGTLVDNAAGICSDVRLNSNTAAGPNTNTITLDGGRAWTPSVVAFTITNPISVTANGGMIQSQNGSSAWNSAISGTGLLILNNSGTGTIDTNLGGNMSGFSGTLAVDTNSVRYLSLSGSNLGSSSANLLFYGNGSYGTVRWNGTAAPTAPICFAELISGPSTTGTVGIIDNSASTTVTYQIGDNTANTPSFAGAIKNTSGTVNVTKVGSNQQTLSGANTYTGTTTASGGTLVLNSQSSSKSFIVNGGTLNFGSSAIINASSPTATVSNGTLLTNSALTSNLSVNVNGGGTFKFGLSSNGSSATVGALTVAGGASSSTYGTIDLVDNYYDTLFATALTIGGTSGNYSVLNLETSATANDEIVSSGILTLNPGGVAVNISGIAGSIPGNNDYTLMTFSSMSGGGSFSLVGTPGGFGKHYSLDSTSGTSLVLHVTGADTPGDAYWKGTYSAAWNYTSGPPANPTNWVDASGNDTFQLPGGTTAVHFTADGATHLNTTLGQNFSIKSLEFTTASDVTIGGASNTLAISSGITVNSGSGTTGHIISTGGLLLTGNQTWYNNSSYAFTVGTSVNPTIISGGPSYGLILSNWAGSGLFVFNGANTYSGGTLIDSNATLRIGNAGALGTGPVTVNGILNLHGQNLIIGALTGTGTITNNSDPGSINFSTTSTSDTFDGVIQNGTGTVAVVKSGSGTTSLTNSNAYSGGTTIAGGILNVANNYGIGSGTISFTGGTIQCASGVVTDHFGLIINSTSAVAIDATLQDFNYAGAIDVSNTGGLTLVGGNLALSGANAYKGTNNINSGTLKLGGSSTALGDAANILNLSTSAVLDLNGQSVSQSTVNLVGTTLTNDMITNSAGGTTGTLNANIVNYQGGLTLTSTGSLAFQLIDNGGSSGRTLTWNSPATLTLGTATTTSGQNRMLQLVVQQGTVLLNMPVEGTSSPICVDRGLTINGAGAVVRLTGTSTNQITDGQLITLELGTLDFNGHNETIGGVTGTATTGVIENDSAGITTAVVNMATTTATAGTSTFNGIIRDHSTGSGIIAITKSSADGIQVLTNVNTYTGPTTISAGTLSLTGSGSISNSSTISIASGATFDVSGYAPSPPAPYSTGVGQTISGSGSIVGSYTHAQGTIVPGTDGTVGTLSFSTGTATISGGNIKIDTSTSSGNDLIALNGTGSIIGAVSVNVGTGLGYTAGVPYTIITQAAGLAPAIGSWTTTWDRRGTPPTLTSTATTVQVTLHTATAGDSLNWSGTSVTSGSAWDIFTTQNWYDTTSSSLDTFHRDDNVAFGDTYDGTHAPSTTAVTLNTIVTPTPPVTDPVTVNAVTFNASTLNYTLSGTGGIAGTTSLVKSGSGTLTITLTSNNNSYSGGTFIYGGTLVVNNDNNVGADPGRITIDKATGMSQAVLESTATFQYALARPFTIGSHGGAIKVDLGQTLTIVSGVVDFEGPLSVQGDGALTLNLTGGAPDVGALASMSIDSNSTLNVGGNDAFSNGTTHMSVDNEGKLNITSGSKTVNAITGGGTTTVSGGTTSLTANSIVQDTLTIGSGTGDTLDIATFNGGSTSSSSLTQVPEPATWAMLMLAAMGLGIYWRRRR